jgi:hypothetical protein
LRTARKDGLEAYWQDEKDWLCTVEFLPAHDPEARAYTAYIVGCLFGHAHLTNSRCLALLGDADADAYEILFSFSSPEGKNQFLDLIRANEDLGKNYIENDFMLPTTTTQEIRNARSLQTILPEDVLIRATFIATSICTGTEDDRAASYRYELTISSLHGWAASP